MNRKEILDAASQAVLKYRQVLHGTPEESFTLTSQLCNLYIERVKLPLRAHDVAVLMILLKVTRIAKTPSNSDNWTDIAGYAACGGEIATEQPQVSCAAEETLNQRPQTDGLSINEYMEASQLGHLLNSCSLNRNIEDDNLIMDAVLRPTTLKFAHLNHLRNLTKK